jgi:phosphoglycerol transferase
MNPGFLIFFALHSVVPAICVALYGARPLWLVSGALFSVAVFWTAQLSASVAMKIVLCVVSGMTMFFTLMLGASYYMQGTGFNAQFFYHLDFNTLPVAVSAYGRAFAPAMLCLLLAVFAPLMFYRWPARRHRSSLAAFLLWLGAVALSYPVQSLMAYRLGAGDPMSGIMPVAPDRLLANKRPLSMEEAEAEQKNIVFIYAEGLEQTYFDQGVFGDLLPNLRELSKSAHRFTNVYQTSGTGWTMAGIVASQCGFPLVVSNHLASNSTIASIDKPFETETCLADARIRKGTWQERVDAVVTRPAIPQRVGAA